MSLFLQVPTLWICAKAMGPVLWVWLWDMFGEGYFSVRGKAESICCTSTGDLHSTIGYSQTPKWKKQHRTGILVDFWAVERHQIHRRLRLHLHQWHHWTAKGTTVGRSNYLRSLDFVDILRIFEGKINSSPQCFLFKRFHIYVLAWFHKFQREGLLRIYLMTNMTSVLLNLRSAPLKPPWTPPLFNFINLFQKWLQFLISSAGSQGDARADVWLGRHRSFVGARTRPLEFGRLKRSKRHCFALHFGGSGLKLWLSLLTTS